MKFTVFSGERPDRKPLEYARAYLRERGVTGVEPLMCLSNRHNSKSDFLFEISGVVMRYKLGHLARNAAKIKERCEAGTFSRSNFVTFK